MGSYTKKNTGETPMPRQALHAELKEGLVFDVSLPTVAATAKRVDATNVASMDVRPQTIGFGNLTGRVAGALFSPCPNGS